MRHAYLLSVSTNRDDPDIRTDRFVVCADQRARVITVRRRSIRIIPSSAGENTVAVFTSLAHRTKFTSKNHPFFISKLVRPTTQRPLKAANANNFTA
ncbi:hypothetical protein WI645_09480 [Vibrio cholerae]